MEKYFFDGVELTQMQAIKQFQNSLISKATGDTFYGEDAYYSEYREILIKSKFKDVCPDFIKECRNVNEFWSFIKSKFKTYQERREFIWQSFKPIFSFLENESDLSKNLILQKAKEVINLDYVNQQIVRMVDAIPTDVDLAIGTAKELIETVCKTILADRGKHLDKHTDVQPLVKLVVTELGQTAENIKEDAKASETIKTLLLNLATIAKAMAELRNAYGTGHGKEARKKGLSPRHARLAVGAASTLALYLWETHEERANSYVKP